MIDEVAVALQILFVDIKTRGDTEEAFKLR
jgi:hypothetical protein